MKKRKTRINPHCPVLGCGTKAPHANDPIVTGLIALFADPESATRWALIGMNELNHSSCRDLRDKKVFAWHTRMRQIEELYVRTLYALFIATPEELPHILCGAPPNAFSPLYDKVNDVVLEGRGLLNVDQPGRTSGTFKPMEVLNAGAHASFIAMATCLGLSRNQERVPSAEKWGKHVATYCAYLEYMNGMFKAGKEKKHVLGGVINLHRPASHWKTATATP